VRPTVKRLSERPDTFRGSDASSFASRFIMYDIHASNGVIHLVDRVLAPAEGEVGHESNVSLT